MVRGFQPLLPAAQAAVMAMGKAQYRFESDGAMLKQSVRPKINVQAGPKVSETTSSLKLWKSLICPPTKEYSCSFHSKLPKIQCDACTKKGRKVHHLSQKHEKCIQQPSMIDSESWKPGNFGGNIIALPSGNAFSAYLFGSYKSWWFIPRPRIVSGL